MRTAGFFLSVFVATAGVYGGAASSPAEDGQLESAGALAFSPQGVLFAADPQQGAVLALEMKDAGSPSSSPPNIPDLSAKLASLLGTSADRIYVRDLAVHPVSGNIYLSVSRGGYRSNYLATQVEDGSTAVLVRVGSDHELEVVDLEGTARSHVTLQRPAEDAKLWGIPSRTFTITDLAYAEGTVLVAGLSNEEFSSRLYRIAYPFGESATSVPVEVYHTSHGRYETHAPIRTLIPVQAGADPLVVAAYTCTPLVVFPLADLKDASKTRGRTAAELGSRNTPIDLAAYRADGEDYLLVANNRHPLMRVRLADLAEAQALTSPTEGGGVKADRLDLPGVRRLASYSGSHLIVLQQIDGLYRLTAVAVDGLAASR